MVRTEDLDAMCKVPGVARTNLDMLAGFGLSFDELCATSVSTSKQILRTKVGDSIVHRIKGPTRPNLRRWSSMPHKLYRVMDSADLINSTARQIFSAATQDFPVPDYLQLPRQLNADREKLS
jgi:glutamyl/glutaminyl-tRNA synthetase